MEANDIYITNVSANATFGDEVRSYSEEKTSYDLKQGFTKHYSQNLEEYGEIARCYVTKSHGENWDTYKAFMSMKDTSTHHDIVEHYNSMRFRGRDIVLRISNAKFERERTVTSSRLRTVSTESTERKAKCNLEELIVKKAVIEN